MAGRSQRGGTEDFKRPNTGDRRTTDVFWRLLSSDPKSLKYWQREAEAVYRRTFKDLPTPGIWPSQTARVELGMALFESLKMWDRNLPEGLFVECPKLEIQQVDCYRVAEQLLDEGRIALLEGAARKPGKSGQKK